MKFFDMALLAGAAYLLLSPRSGEAPIQSAGTTPIAAPVSTPVVDAVSPWASSPFYGQTASQITKAWVSNPTNITLTKVINDIQARIGSGGYSGARLADYQNRLSFYQQQRYEAGQPYSQAILAARRGEW